MRRSTHFTIGYPGQEAHVAKAQTLEHMVFAMLGFIFPLTHVSLSKCSPHDLNRLKLLQEDRDENLSLEYIAVSRQLHNTSLLIHWEIGAGQICIPCVASGTPLVCSSSLQVIHVIWGFKQNWNSTKASL